MRRYLLVAFILLGALILRESGIVHIFFAAAKPSWETSISASFRGAEATSVDYVLDTGQPFVPEIRNAEDTYRCTVTYRINTSLSPWRWLPIFKFGHNQAQLTYIVWAGQSPLGCGALTSEGTLSIFGIASARDYANQFVEPLVWQMKREVDPRIHIFTRGNNQNPEPKQPAAAP